MYQAKGKRALITGAARGVGYLTAKFMASRGCNLILHSGIKSTRRRCFPRFRTQRSKKAEAEFDSPYKT